MSDSLGNVSHCGLSETEEANTSGTRSSTRDLLYNRSAGFTYESRSKRQGDRISEAIAIDYKKMQRS
jgi:hypothetical protein